MATNIVIPGVRRLTVTPAANVNSGDFLRINGQHGIALASGNTTVNVAMEQGCVAVIRKLNGASTSQAVGTNVHWDATNSNATISATSNTLIGTAYRAVTNNDTTIQVVLNLGL